MGSWLLRAFRRDSDQVPTIRSLVVRLQELEDRMDRDEAVRSTWVGTVKRTLARINKANDRAEEIEQEQPENGHPLPNDLHSRANRLYGRTV